MILILSFHRDIISDGETKHENKKFYNSHKEIKHAVKSEVLIHCLFYRYKLTQTNKKEIVLGTKPHSILRRA